MRELVIHPMRWLFVGLLVLLIAVIGCSSGEKADTQTAAEEAAAVSETIDETVTEVKDVLASLANPELGVDPVCKMEIDGSLTIEVGGKNYGFCSEECAAKFKENPEKYLVVAEDSEE
ncbi:MAG: YHS domain-containing protein [Candidatus Latescibacterota bacterium]